MGWDVARSDGEDNDGRTWKDGSRGDVCRPSAYCQGYLAVDAKDQVDRKLQSFVGLLAATEFSVLKKDKPRRLVT